jgi:tryptophan-rich sensory protein
MKQKTARRKKVSEKKSSIAWFPLLGWIALCEAAGIVGSFFTVSAIPTWYATLARPSFSPPNWVFGPVWTVLYMLMGIAVYRVWRLGMHKPAVKTAVSLFIVHLFFNAIWSILFFGAKNIPLAFVDITVIWVTLIYIIFRFEKLDRASAYLLLPYLAWISFATVLNYNYWLLNA